MSGILTYRVLRNTKKYYLKWIHASIMVVSFVLAVVALKAVFDSHNLPDPPLANLYSLHLKVCGILNWDMKWDPLLEEEMMKPIDEMIPVCKALKILQWMIYFIIISILVMCIAHFS